MACPAAATCLRMPGSYVACRPIGKKIALVQCAARAASTAGVFFGQGPSSKVSTTSPSRRKSWLLKCSKPKPGPPVVSISTVRAMPSAFGLPGHDEPALAAGGGAAAGVGAAEAGFAAVFGAACATVVGAASTGATSAGAAATGGAVTGAAATGTTVTGAAVLAGFAASAAVAATVGAGAGAEVLCARTAPTTATQTSTASAHAAATRRMASLPPLLPHSVQHATPQSLGRQHKPSRSINNNLSGQFGAKSTKPPIIGAKVAHCGNHASSGYHRRGGPWPRTQRGRPPGR